MGRLVHTSLGSRCRSYHMSSTLPLPPREQLCNRYCSNKQQLAIFDMKYCRGDDRIARIAPAPRRPPSSESKVPYACSSLTSSDRPGSTGLSNQASHSTVLWVCVCGSTHPRARLLKSGTQALGQFAARPRGANKVRVL